MPAGFPTMKTTLRRRCDTMQALTIGPHLARSRGLLRTGKQARRLVSPVSVLGNLFQHYHRQPPAGTAARHQCACPQM